MFIKIIGNRFHASYAYVSELNKVAPQPILHVVGEGPSALYVLPRIVVTKPFKVVINDEIETENVFILRELPRPQWVVDVYDLEELTTKYPHLFMPIRRMVKEGKVDVVREFIILECKGNITIFNSCFTGRVETIPSGYVGEGIVRGLSITSFVPREA